MDLEEILSEMQVLVEPNTPIRPTLSRTSTKPLHVSETGRSCNRNIPLETPEKRVALELRAEGENCLPASQHGHVDRSGVPTHPISRFSSEITEEQFQPLWARGEPVVVHGLLDKFKIRWTPGYFIDNYGREQCHVVDCVTDKRSRLRIKEFFQEFGKADRGEGVLKLKDWPPHADFREKFRALYIDFMNALPIPNYTRRDGVLNLASHFAINAVAPDLGPKMYNAFKSSEGTSGQGSTRLHMDMADAVNVMMFAHDSDGKLPGAAAWDIFRASDSDKIRAYLRRHFDDRSADYADPIHSQLFYLDSSHRRQLYEEEKVYSWRIYQQPGEAVFIPAGCAHQVCNLADCIKVAIDFVSLENIDRCEKLTAEFRDENITETWKEDVLQLRTMMMYAWRSASQLRENWNL
ncbi:hypothetical protein FRC12_000341 [Ceratobasidium sp. 428]|nr:hypothetical protein FRC12_000341 [Ceratobasidium sp. 428]